MLNEHADETIEERLVDAYGYLRDATDDRGWRIPQKRIPAAYHALVAQLGLEMVKKRGKYYFSRSDVKRIEQLGIHPVNPSRHENAWTGYSQAVYEMDEHTSGRTGYT